MEEAPTLEEELMNQENMLPTQKDVAADGQKSVMLESETASTNETESEEEAECDPSVLKENKAEESAQIQYSVPKQQIPIVYGQPTSISQAQIIQQEFIVHQQQPMEEAPKTQSESTPTASSLKREMLFSFKMMSNMRVPENSNGQGVFLGGELFEKQKKVLVVDLDETLIHSDMKQRMTNPDYSIPICCNGQMGLIQINIRPYAKECLFELSQYYEIVVFTASSSEYAQLVVNLLDPHRQYISRVLSRDQCYLTEGNFLVKDLRIFKDRAQKDIVIVDNCILSFAFQLDNGIPITSYYQGREDRELLLMMRYLVEIRNEEDVRVINRKSFKLVDMARMWHSSPTIPFAL